MWQDTVIAICQLAFIPSMIPTLRGKNKPAFSTCMSNFVLVSIICAMFVSLELWYSAATSSLMAAVWGVLALQTRRS